MGYSENEIKRHSIQFSHKVFSLFWNTTTPKQINFIETIRHENLR
jgi:hypothetical protein